MTTSYIIGNIKGETPKVILPKEGELSLVPHSEPGWLSEGFSSPYYNDGHRKFQKAMRLFFDQHITPQAREHELTGKRLTQELVDLMGKHHLNAMRLGPGKHLHGLDLPGGLKGEDYNYFVSVFQIFIWTMPTLMQVRVDIVARAHHHTRAWANWRTRIF